MRKELVSAAFAFIANLLTITPAFAANSSTIESIPIEFILFALTLLGVALFHNKTFHVALGGLIVISFYKIFFSSFNEGPGLTGYATHITHEWVTLTNLFCLLMGFAILARHFEKSHVPVVMPKYLPDDWKGAFFLLVGIFVISAFLDNIAAALIGGAMAHQLFKTKVHIGYLAAIVAAANAGGSGSVVGDTTTTMMWIQGIPAASVLHAYIAAVVALLIFGVVAARQQQAYSPIIKNAHIHTRIDWPRIAIVALILLFAVTANVVVNQYFNEYADRFPFIGVAVWLAILVTIPIRRHDWEVLDASLKGTLFLLALVTCASLMPVDQLPPASWPNAFGLGFISAVFDNIPLTKLAIAQGGYDWGVLAFAVGFGGSMIWFGSSAGVAISNMYPEAKSVSLWLRHGWHVVVAYIVGFFVLIATLGWNP